MVVDSVSVSIQVQKDGARRLSMQGRPFGLSVLLTRAKLQQLLDELSLALVPTHYETLGIGPAVADDEIQAAYRTLAKQHHPDLNGTHIDMTQLNEAYETLIDPEKREKYNATMKA